MRIMLIGDPNAIHMYNFIKYFLLDYSKGGAQIFLFSFNNGNNNSLKYKNFYRKNNIHVIVPGKSFSVLHKIPKIGGIISLLNSYVTFIRIVKIHKEFDILHIHYVDPQFSIILKRYKNHFKEIITTFWGSDLIRLRSGNIKKTENLLSISSIITVVTDAMEQSIYKIFGYKYKDKVKHARFGFPVLDVIKRLAAQESIEDSKTLLHLPKNKIILTCGYNASRAQQHKMIINAINKCSKEIRDRLYVIFPLAYPVDAGYIAELRQYLKKCGFKYFLNTEFLNEINTARLRRVSDTMVHAQLTDAFAGSVQEHIYANNIVFNGSWLEYPILDKEQIYYIKFDNEDDLSERLINTVNNLSFEKEKAKEKCGLIYQLTSWKYLKCQWESLYKRS